MTPTSTSRRRRSGAATALRVGVDTGGTFTDLVGVSHGTVVTRKLPSTPADPSAAILAGVADVVEAARRMGQGPQHVIHGSTVATNAVLEGRAADVALVTTAGFEDVIRIGRQTRPRLYDLFVPAPRRLVHPSRVFGIRERMAADGAIVTSLRDEDVDALVGKVISSGATVVAVCLLHSYINPLHEARIAAALRKAGCVVCASTELLPEYREYERWSTTVVNACVTPIMRGYLLGLESRLRPATLTVMQSNGGVVSTATACSQAIRTILSGPAGGVIGAKSVGAAAGFKKLITLDMGGTSTDVSLVDGVISTTSESVVGGLPVRVPMIDIQTIGAGGGSIAWLDDGRALRVGPRSAGAVPGPACYGTSECVTVTDANLLLGRLDADRFLGGRMSLDAARTVEMVRPLAARAGLDVLSFCEGVVRVANANMARAIRAVSIERGHDPRAFVLCAFGGAGGLHGCDLAGGLGIATVVVPRYAGVLSALGMTMADVRRDYVANVLGRRTSLQGRPLTRVFVTLERQAHLDLRDEGVPRAARVLTRLVDVRYVGQSYELTVPFTATFASAFHDAHKRAYGFAARARAVEVVNVRLTAIGRTEPLVLPRKLGAVRRPAVRLGSRAGRFGGRKVLVALYDWALLEPGMSVEGPAVITGAEASALISPAWSARVDAWGNLVAKITGTP